MSAINSYAGSGSPLTVAQYKANLDSIAAVASNTYDKIDCSGFTYKAKNNQGYHGATTNFNQRDELYYELRIQNPDNHDDYEQLIILIMCNEHTDIMSIIDSEVFKAVVNEIRPE